MKTDWKAFINDKTRMLLTLVALLTGTSYMGAVHRYLELTSHFRLQYLAASALLLSVLLLFRDWRWGLVAATCTVLNAVAVLPWYLKGPETEFTQDGQKVRLLLSNVFTDNRQTGRLISLIGREQPDLLVLQEVNAAWMRALEPLTPSFPFSVSRPSSDNFGIAVMSRIAFARVDEEPLTDSIVPSIAFNLGFDGKQISFLATHPLPPVGKEGFAARNAQLHAIGTFARQSLNRVVVIGDLNVTMWSPYYSALIQTSGLRNCRKGFGLLPTWPAHLAFISIPLDHCLISPTIRVASIRTGANIGSDHLPLIVDLVIAGGDAPNAIGLARD